MKNFVITIRDLDKSIAAATKCITSGRRNGIEIDFYEAFTPKDCHEFIKDQKINDSLFNNLKHSRDDNTRAAFCSHFSLWQYSAEQNEEVTIFEHDAIVVSPIPNLEHNGCISFGKPSYGNYITPPNLGRNRLVSKKYFPGAHAYRVKPNAAQILIDNARLQASPTDLFLNITRFPFLEEFYPWPVEVRETFTTIQKERGCIMKHMYDSNYEII